MAPPTKRRRTEPTVVEEISFDPAARQEYLTGFHKRKLQRAKAAQEAAERRARAERIEERRKLREGRKAELERHVQEVNALLTTVSASASSDSENDDNSETGFKDEWNGIADTEPSPLDHEAEYIDEDKYTTVTVEAMDVTREGLFKAQQEKEGNGQDDENRAARDTDPGGRATTSKGHGAPDKPRDTRSTPKKKRKKFRYESKAERKLTRAKEKLRKSKQARARRAD